MPHVQERQPSQSPRRRRDDDLLVEGEPSSSSSDQASKSSSDMEFSSDEVPVYDDEEPLSDKTPSDKTGGDTEKMSEAAEDLGNIEAMDGSFYKEAGGLVDAMVPRVGQHGKLQLDIAVPVDSAGLCTVGFKFVAKVNRSDKGVTCKFEVLGEVGVSKKVDVYLATVEAFAKAGVNGYIEAFGDNGTACFRMMGLAIRERLASANESIADAIFDREYVDDTVEMMGEDDYVETGLAATASAGVSASVDGEIGDMKGGLSGKGTGKAGVSTRTRLTKGEDGGLKSTTTNEADASASAKLTASLSGDVKDFKVAGALSFAGSVDDDNGATGTISLSASGEADMDGDEVSELMQDGAYLADTLSSLGNLVNGAKAQLGQEDTARMAGSLGNLFVTASGSGHQIDQAAIEAAQELEGTSVTVKYKLSAVGSVDQDLKPSATLKLQKTNQVKVGGGMKKAKVEVLVENLQDMFNITLG